MAIVKGSREYDKHRTGERLSRKEAILAFCFECHGESEGAVDCLAEDCPLYPFFPYQGVEISHEAGGSSGFYDTDSAEEFKGGIKVVLDL